MTPENESFIGLCALALLFAVEAGVSGWAGDALAGVRDVLLALAMGVAAATTKQRAPHLTALIATLIAISVAISVYRWTH